jgi:hypothetical protein
MVRISTLKTGSVSRKGNPARSCGDPCAVVQVMGMAITRATCSREEPWGTVSTPSIAEQGGIGQPFSRKIDDHAHGRTPLLGA